MNTANFVSIPASMLPDQEILSFAGRRFAYGELLGRIRRLAGSLRALGVERGQAVGALDTNSADYVATYYAAATLGAVFVPLNYRAKPPELEYMISAAKIVAIFVGGRYADLLDSLRPMLPSLRAIVGYGVERPGWLRFDDLMANGEEVEDAEVDETDVSILMYTSGTTSLPKGVLLTHGDFTTYVTNTAELADGSDRGSALVSVPFYHIAGTAQMMTTMWSGRRLVIMPQFDPVEWLRTVEREVFAEVERDASRTRTDRTEAPGSNGEPTSASRAGAPLGGPMTRSWPPKFRSASSTPRARRAAAALSSANPLAMPSRSRVTPASRRRVRVGAS